MEAGTRTFPRCVREDSLARTRALSAQRDAPSSAAWIGVFRVHFGAGWTDVAYVDGGAGCVLGRQEETYDVVVLGTGLTECILSGVLSVEGKKAS